MNPRMNLLLLFVLASFCQAPDAFSNDADAKLDFRIERLTATKGYDGKKHFVHARAGIIPPHTPDNPADQSIVVMTMQRALTLGSDLYYGLYTMRTDDLGQSWTGPVTQESFLRRKFPAGGEIAASDFWPKWHAASGKLLGTGHTIRYLKKADFPVPYIVPGENPRVTSHATYDPQTRTWSAWKGLELPEAPQFQSSGAGSTQRYDLPNGDILLPVYYYHPDRTVESSMVLRCRFDGDALRNIEHGNEMWVDFGRGFSEPSLTKFADWFYLTLRNDDAAYITRGRDGLHFEKPRKWTFDDGKDLGSYNTQAHWVTHSEGLFLVYTRRGANNDHVFRHRAPLFIARVDPDRMEVIRASERILVPERGARLGNFGITDISPRETWVTVTEWMQRQGPDYIIPLDNKYGANNSVYVAKIKWNRPNILLK